MQYCSKCGAQNVDGANFCNHCAAPLRMEAQPAPQGQAYDQQQAGAQTVPPPRSQPGERATLLDYLRHYEGLRVHWAKRFIGILLDSIFVVAPVYVILFVMEWWMGWVWFTAVAGVVLFLYSAFFESAMGGTIGKGAVGLKVICVSGKLELSNALIRNVTKIFALLLLLEFVATLVVQTTDSHQRYMDRLARTTVVEKKP